MPARKDIAARFFDHYREEGDCWIWTGKHTPSGLPTIYSDGTSISARRVAVREFTDRDPNGNIKPSCGNPSCVRPEHMIVSKAGQKRLEVIQYVQDNAARIQANVDYRFRTVSHEGCRRKKNQEIWKFAGGRRQMRTDELIWRLATGEAPTGSITRTCGHADCYELAHFTVE